MIDDASRAIWAINCRLDGRLDAPVLPELNAQKHTLDELREKSSHNKTFASLNLLKDHLGEALSVVETQHAKVKVSWCGIELLMLFLVRISITILQR